MQPQEAYEHRHSLETRLVVLRVGIILAISAMVVGFWLLQVVQNGKFQTMAQSNHLRKLPLRAPRGVLFDRNGRELVQNRRSWTITVVRDRDTDVRAAVERLAGVLRLDDERVTEILDRQKRQPLFRIPVVERATIEQVAAVLSHKLELPEVEVEDVPTRAYPSGGLAAHLFGYVGEIRPEQIKSGEFSDIDPGAVVGQTGLERLYNADLQGEDGSRIVVVNSVGRQLDVVGEDDPVEGSRLQLTIDYDLQKAAEESFQALGFVGGSVFLDPRNGEILALTSLPAFDPNDFASGIDSKTFNALMTDPLKPLYNKIIKGRYPPGSVFKIVMAIAALSEGIITPDHTEYCDGVATIYGSPRRCLGHHGRIDLITALEKSCNIYFYHLGEMLDIDTIHKYAAMLGLDGLTGIDLPGEEASFVGSREWKQKLNGEQWYPGDTISVAIGQGYIGVTPLALATMISTVANGGTLITPHLVRAEDRGQGWQPIPSPPARGQLFLRPDVLSTVREALGRVVQSGTAIRGRINGVPYAGKTGTAQANISLANRRAGGDRFETRDHGFFVFYAPLDNPQIAGVIFGEHAEHGSSTSPIAKHVIETFLAKQQGRPLPPSPLTRTASAGTTPAARPGTPGAPGTAPAPGAGAAGQAAGGPGTAGGGQGGGR
ncbi:MAG: penicillin-binding protein 2 [Vicinamibacterales bacterium]